MSATRTFSNGDRVRVVDGGTFTGRLATVEAAWPGQVAVLLDICPDHLTYFTESELAPDHDTDRE